MWQFFWFEACGCWKTGKDSVTHGKSPWYPWFSHLAGPPGAL
jgi:hypothetical protein